MPALGIIGAKGNNKIGVAGINWNVSMILLKMCAQRKAATNNPDLRKTKAAEAIRFAVDNSARVINWSGFVSSKDYEALTPLKEAIDYAEENSVLIVVEQETIGKILVGRKIQPTPYVFKMRISLLLLRSILMENSIKKKETINS